MVRWISQREYVRRYVRWVVCRVQREISFAGRAAGAVGSHAVYAIAVATAERCLGAFPPFRIPLHGHYNARNKSPGKGRSMPLPRISTAVGLGRRTSSGGGKGG